MATQQEIDAQTGLHNTSGYDQSGGRIAGGQVDNYGGSAITPSSLQQTTPIQPTIAQPIANPTVPDFLQVNQQEKQLQDQYTQGNNVVADLMGQLAGRDAYTTGQQQQQDVIGKQANVTNYQNQIKALQQSQQGIDIQRQQNIQAKQQAMSGQGISDSIVNRHSAIDTQYNQQTLDNAIQQYKVGASLSAAQGDLTSALNYVDQAVKLKYQPIEAQITAQNANLEAIKNNPAFISATQKQAEARQLQLQQYAQKIADEKKVYSDTQDAIIQTVHNNPVIKPYTDPTTGKTYSSQQIQAAISAAQSPSEVAQLVNYFGLSSISKSDQLDQTYKQAQIDKANYDLAHPNRQTQIIESNGKKLLVDSNTGETIKDYGEQTTGGANGTFQTVNGKLKLLDPKTGAVIHDYGSNLSQAEQDKAKQAEAERQAALPTLNQKVSLINDILNNTQGLNSMVGTHAYQRLTDPYQGLVGSANQDFVAGVSQLIQQNTLDALINLKKAGGTLGALSEGEGAMLREAASKIGTWQHKDSSGNIQYYDTSEKSFVKELNTIKELTQKAITNAGAGTTLSPEDTAQIDKMFSGNVDPASYY